MITKSKLQKDIDRLENALKENVVTYNKKSDSDNDKFRAICEYLDVHFEEKKTVEQKFQSFSEIPFIDVIVSTIVVVKNKKSK